MTDELVFDFAVRFANGFYYTGRAGSAFQGAKCEAFTFNERGAYNKIARMGWAGATVERVL